MRVRVTHLVSRGAWLVATVIIVASLAKSASAAPLIFLDRDVFDIAAHPQTIGSQTGRLYFQSVQFHVQSHVR
jgi:hypothetical protein